MLVLPVRAVGHTQTLIPPSATAGADPPLPGPFSRLGVPGSQSSPALILPPVRAGDRPEAFRETHLSRAFCLRRARAVCPQPESLKSWVWAAQRRIKSICVTLVEALRELQVAKEAAGGRSASAPATQEWLNLGHSCKGGRFGAFLVLIGACCVFCEGQRSVYTRPHKGRVKCKHSCNMKGIIKGLDIQWVCLAGTVVKLKFQAQKCSNINLLLWLNYLRAQICHDLSESNFWIPVWSWN